MNNNFMSRTIFSFILAATLLTGVLVALQAMPIDSNQAMPQNETLSIDGVSLVNADEDGISFVLNTSQIEILADGTLSSNIALNTAIQTPGSPELPYFSTYIAIPPEALISVNVSQEDASLLSDVFISAVPEPILSGGNSGPDSISPVTAVSPPQPSTRIPNPAIYTNDSLYPHQVYQLSEPVYFRDMRLVKLDLYPVQYNPLRQELQQSHQMHVDIKFEGAQLANLQPAPSKNDTYQSSAAGMILNFEQGKAWRSLPLPKQEAQINSLAETAVPLPLGTESYKIKIDQDGIYDITGADLAAAGMSISTTSPNNIEMMSRGESVAYDFIKIGGTANILESNDIIRFYGEGVNGSRYEKQFLNHNIYWLWADGAATHIVEVDNSPGVTSATTFTDSITREDEHYFFATWTNQWDDDYSNNAWNDFPNEADSWYWDLISAGTETYSVDLPDPVIEAGQIATYTIELMTREYLSNYSYQVDSCLNSLSECTVRSWTGHKNVNIVQTVPVTSLVSGTNEFTVTLSGSSGSVAAYLNRITIDYLRTLKAQDDQLIFTDVEGGQAMEVQDFGESNPDNILVWDITSPKTPTKILLEAGDIVENNGRYTYTIGIDSSTAQNYIATTTANILTTTNKISQYTAPTNLDPADGADWIAISYSGFITEANRLANHREQADYGEYKTHVVDIKDVIDVYGHGLATPVAINTYLKNAVETWSTKPSYVVLVGNATISPRNLECTSNCITGWDNDAENFVLTDLQFKGRWQGLVPSDNPLVFLFGESESENDLIPDMAIGRITSESVTQTTSIIDKIIRYEENLIAEAEAEQDQRILFLADFPDPAAGDPSVNGSFCRTNAENTGTHIPSEGYEQVHLCIEDYTTEEDFDEVPFIEAIKAETYQGISIMNYRGHGAFQYWGSPRFWEATPSVSDEQLKNTWANNGKPVIIISADCQDGNFAWPGYSTISERFLVMDDLTGSAAHWGSAGFGYDYEHTVLLEGFYDGIFEHNQIALGDAINYAKLYFMQSGSYAESEIYNFNLQGDPATMTIYYNPEYSNFLPVIIK